AARTRSGAGSGCSHSRQASRKDSSPSTSRRHAAQPTRWASISSRTGSASSPSTYGNTFAFATLQSILSLARLIPRPGRLLHRPPHLDQAGPEEISPTIEPGHHGADGPVHDVGDLPIREPLHVAQLDDLAHLLGQPANRLPHLLDGFPPEQQILGGQRHRA